MVQLLLEKEADVAVVSKHGRTPLHLASQNGQLKVVQLLLEKEADVASKDQAGVTPLHVASSNGYLEVGRPLPAQKQSNLNLNHDNSPTPLSWSVSNGCIDGKGRTPLMLAIREGHENVVKLLLHYGCSICSADRDKLIIHAALFMTQVGFKELLLFTDLKNDKDLFGLRVLFQE